MEEQGFIKLNRRFFKNPLWKEPRQLSRAEAWLDLISTARFEASKEILNNRVIEVHRGELIASRRFLEQRWGWGSSKVTNFLEYLKSEGMINHRQTNGQTIITLCNYDTYNGIQTNEYAENKPPTNQTQTSREPATNQNKECKERKELKEDNKEISSKDDKKKTAPDVATRKEEFYNSLIPFTGKYPKDMIRKFYDYWSELNRSGKKMRFELQTTWELPKRLVTWSSKETNYDTKSNYNRKAPANKQSDFD